MADLTFSTLTFPVSYPVRVVGISNSGQVFGGYADDPTPNRFAAEHGFILSGGQFTTLDVPNEAYTEVRGISDTGEVFGYYYNYYSNPPSSFTVSGGQYNFLSFPGAYYTQAQGISASGDVFGSYIDSTGTHAFTEHEGQLTLFNAPGASSTSVQGISASGQIVGTYSDGTGQHAFIESGGTFTTLNAPGASDTFITGISASGQVFGTYNDATGQHGFIESEGAFTTLNAPGASSTFVIGISASGQVLGTYNDGTGQHSFIESEGTFTTLNVPGATSTSVKGISASGQIVGTYKDATGEHVFISSSADTTHPGVTPSTLTLQVSEDQWTGQPDAQFVVKVDGQQVGDVHTVTALHSAGQTQDVSLTGDFSGAHQISVEFLNDQYGGPNADVNLYVDSFAFNGVTLPGSQATVDPSVGTQVGSGVELFRNGAATFDVTKGGLTLQMSEDDYQGDAQFQVVVDGHAVGGVQTAHASHAAGQFEAFTLQGDFSGAHQVAVQFLNDLYGGDNFDRNLYVDSISLNGQTMLGSQAALDGDSGTYAGTSAELYRNGLATFNVDDLHHAGLLMV